jgi:hypothetical protein
MNESIFCKDCGELLLPDDTSHWENCDGKSDEVVA